MYIVSMIRFKVFSLPFYMNLNTLIKSAECFFRLETSQFASVLVLSSFWSLEANNNTRKWHVSIHASFVDIK